MAGRSRYSANWLSVMAALTLWAAAVGPAEAQIFSYLTGGEKKETESFYASEQATPHPAVARIIVSESDSTSLGSGTLVDARGEYGLVLTNWHVVRDSRGGPITVLFPGGFYSQARVQKTDEDWDLAALVVHRPPGVEPVRISTLPPQRGEPLSIAGYGGGRYRLATGRCTQYVSPGKNLPYEIVELSIPARQGDSGGPIFNGQGELAGVLFGSTSRQTMGSYGGRVARFLEDIVPAQSPDGLASTDTPPAGASLQLPSGAPPSPNDLADSTNLTYPITPDAWRETSADPASPASADPPSPGRMVSDPRAAEGGPITPPNGIVSAENLSSQQSLPATLPAGSLGTPPIVSPPAPADEASTTSQADPPTESAAAGLQWEDLAGHTLLDQAKSVLALIGLAALALVFFNLFMKK